MKRNEERIIKRNWKKIGIWSAVGSLAIAGITCAIYFPIVLNRDNGPELPSNLIERNVKKTIDFKNERADNERWGMFVADEDSDTTDYALYGQSRNDEDFEDELHGPFGAFLELEQHVSNRPVDKWTALMAEDIESAKKELARVILNDNDENFEEQTEAFKYYGGVNQDSWKGSTDWTSITQETITANHYKNEDESEWVLESSVESILEGPMWIIWEGDQITHVVSGIDTEDETALDETFFESWIYEGLDLPAEQPVNKY